MEARGRCARSPAVRIAALVLAAGVARRFGSDKRLHVVGGEPMLTRTLRAYRCVFENVAAVIRPREPNIAALVTASRCHAIEAPDAHLGQSRSLAAGVRALRDADALLIGLGDMPFVRVETLARLAAALTRAPNRIVRPTHRGRPGNPVGFPKTHYDALTQLVGDTGARHLVAANPDVRAVAVNDAGVLRDIDRTSDVTR